MTDTFKCLGCTGRRERGQEVCSCCWRLLPASTRSSLGRRDAHAERRRHQLRQALQARTPLAIIRVVR